MIFTKNQIPANSTNFSPGNFSQIPNEVNYVCLQYLKLKLEGSTQNFLR